MSKSGKIAFIVLTQNKNTETGVPAQMLQQELERTIAEGRRIDEKWSVEKITVIDDP